MVWKCQCPHGLIPHFYGSQTILYALDDYIVCQCPHGLIPHFYGLRTYAYWTEFVIGVNALTGLYLISTYSK